MEELKNYNKLANTLWIIFKFCCAITITFLISYKILVNEISISISNIDYNILLSYSLAFFSLVLSMMFYFKSNDSSNQFYDNTYKFTKDISIILGRIEAGFGEKLQNLDKGYSGILNKIDPTKANKVDLQETLTDKKELQISIHNEIKERNDIIKDLIEKTQLEKQEKKEIIKSLSDKEKTILKLEKDLRYLQQKLERHTTNSTPARLLDFLQKRLKRENIDPKKFTRKDAQEFINKYIPNSEERKQTSELYMDLRGSNIINSEERITLKGYITLRNIVNS